MTRASFVLMALSSLVLPSCNSVSLGGSNNESDAGGSSTSTSGSSPTGGSGGNRGTDTPDASVLGGQGGGTSGTEPCKGMDIPDFDCGYGTPTYICVARGSGWAWDYTCPERPQDAGTTKADVQRPADTASCPGPNPAARTCRISASECIPSSCSCGSYGSWACTQDCGNLPLCDVDAGVVSGCDIVKAAEALSAAGIVTVGVRVTVNEDLAANLASGPNWGVKDIECREGGYDLSPVAGKSVCLVSFDTTSLCQQLPAQAWVVMSEGTVRCIYRSADLSPGIYSVHDMFCSTPDAGTTSCPGPNPAERTCRTTTSECIPSTCTCGSPGSPNDWRCTTDCRSLPLCNADGGVPSCPGTNPAARTCTNTASDCIPSSCTCTSDGNWRCTTDCRSFPLCNADGGTADGADR